MGARFHHEGTKGKKMLPAGPGRMACRLGLITPMLMLVLAALASPLRAGEPVDAETLRLAQWKAVQEWENALPYALTWHSDERRMPRNGIGTLWWFNGVPGFVASDLRATNPGREGDIVGYINSILIPAMDARRDAYICGYTRLYYSFGKQWIELGAIVDRGFPDPFAPIAYFIAPTRGYLRDHGLALSPTMLRQLERNARMAPEGRFWREAAALPDHIPCDTRGGTWKTFGVQL